MVRLFQERLEKTEKIYEEYKKIEERLLGIADSAQKTIRLKALRYGITLLESDQNFNQIKHKDTKAQRH